MMSKQDATSKQIAVRIPSWLGCGREIYQGIASYVTEHQLEWHIITEVDADDELKPQFIDKSWKGDGAIFFRYSDEEAEALRQQGCPVVCVSRLSQCSWVSRVNSDNRMIGRLAAEHLVSTGAPNLACWIDPERSYCLERLEGFREVAAKYNREVLVLETLASSYPSDRKWSIIREEMKQQLQQLPKPTALLARDDIAAAGLINMAQSLGIKVPEELSVLGVGNDPVLGAITLPTMSSIDIPAKEIGKEAARVLHHQMENPGEVEVVEIPIKHVVKRVSTQFFHTSDELVARACQLIKLADPEKPITVKAVCDELGVSATTLLKRFQAVMMCSPKKFIDRTRYEEACRLLETLNAPIKHVAYSLGFKSPEEFDRFFKRHAGMTPGKYRENARV
ncbi:substrate-binding domain-containing protein [Rubritalea tangerina]|uniref:Substrate-binding domain-containing protein n=2 Tax=Rubritalea tangerina TaxID=430798 RepID=A0ABW4ZD03_9BACT